jgi:mannose-6-phosphate isomerase
VYDYGRVDTQGKLRELHIEKALAVIEFDGTKGGAVKPLQWSRIEFDNWLLVACPYFATERWDVRQAILVLRDRFRFLLTEPPLRLFSSAVSTAT